jgi:hypothetical protein
MRSHSITATSPANAASSAIRRMCSGRVFQAAASPKPDTAMAASRAVPRVGRACIMGAQGEQECGHVEDVGVTVGEDGQTSGCSDISANAMKVTQRDAP